MVVFQGVTYFLVIRTLVVVWGCLILPILIPYNRNFTENLIAGGDDVFWTDIWGWTSWAPRWLYLVESLVLYVIATSVADPLTTVVFVCFCFNSLAPGKFEWNFRYLIFQIISLIGGWGISCELLRWMSLDLTDNKSTLVRVRVRKFYL